MRGPGDLDVAGTIDRFLADLAIGKSPATVTTYRTALRHFQAGLTASPIRSQAPANDQNSSSPHPLISSSPHLSLPLADLDEEQPIEFARRLVRERPGLPKATLMTYTTAVMRFYAYLLREGYRSDLPLPRIAERLKAMRGKRARGLPRVPEDAVVEAILAAARKRPPRDEVHLECIRLRDIAIIECLRGSGMRVSELVGLRRSDLVRSQQSARVTGKGSKVRIVYFTPAAWRSLDTYFAARSETGAGRSIALQPVFARHDRGAGSHLLPLSTKSIRQIVKELASVAQQEDAGVTPHRFRAWFATHMVETTGDLAATQDMLGYESADTTRVYTRVASQRLRELHRLAFEDDGAGRR
jgi:site-specific recombinase XerD